MLMLRRARRATYRIWWRHLPWSLPVSRAMAPMLIALGPVLVRENIIVGFIASVGSIFCSVWAGWATYTRSRAKTGWHPWIP